MSELPQRIWSDEDWERIQRGYGAQDMDEKWDVFTEGEVVFIEFRLLAALMAASGGIVRRRELVRAAWPEGAQVHENTLDQYLTRLRRKLRAAGSERTIGTARGIGHRLS